MVAENFDSNEEEALIPDADIIEMLSSRYYFASDKELIDDRLIHYKKEYKDRIQIIIFEGGHEILSDVALDHISD